jgi:hypothetical protein
MEHQGASLASHSRDGRVRRLANRSPESLYRYLGELAFGVPHKNPTSTGPEPPPQDPHGHDSIPRHTPAFLLKWG